MSRTVDAPALLQRGRFDAPSSRTRLRAPAAPGHLVPRDRVVALLDDLTSYPVVAVVAPAGAGKTTLAAEWVRRGGRRTGWLTLEDGDRDPVRLGTSLLAGVDVLEPGVSARVTGFDGDPTDPADATAWVRGLAEDLGADTAPAVLVVDDLQRIDDSAAAAAFAAFVEHQPPWLHLVLLSRRRAPLPVERLRAGGRMADLVFDVLRFTDDEAVAMLAGLCPDTPADQLPALATWADGWAAALQLAALSVRSRPGGYAGSGRLVGGYVWREVLDAERPELVDLLVSTAVVPRLNYGLAEALTGRPDAGDLLVEAEERGLFVTDLDAGGWFEVHGLVRELLLADLARRRPDRLREQHARAARWCEDVGDGPAALEHWLAAEAPAEALRLLSTQAVQLADSGQASVVERTLARIPATVAAADTRSLVQLAWARLPVDRGGFADALAAATAGAPSPGTGARLDGQLDVLHAAAAYVGGDWTTCTARAAAAADPSAAADPAAGLAWSLVARGTALRESWSESDPAVVAARAAVSADAERRLAHDRARVVGLALAGRPVDALRLAAGVRATLGSAPGRTDDLDLAEAVAAGELGDREVAEPALEALAGRSAYPSTWVPLLAALELTEARLGDGDLTGAARWLARATEVADQELPGADARGRVARTGVLVALAADDVPGAEQWVQRCPDPFWGPVAAARVHLHEGRRREAADALGLAEPRCVRHRVVRDLALAGAVVDEDREAAHKRAEGAVDLAAEAGLLRSVAAEGPAVVELVELAAWRAPEAWLARLRRAQAPAAVPARSRELVVELTEREREVLRLLPSRLTLREIAAELFVSPNTLKFHLRVIYRKLGVNSRSEAVDTARVLRLLARR
ncbi:LuxR C-terminal-related transcriptional regulator [Nocardioides sp.]|uniref:LuxR C-terminal-related transcriptional regulator n=1 Tax=Nocardioides sp. TaxID=35761 RepID=UPI0037846A2B